MGAIGIMAVGWQCSTPDNPAPEKCLQGKVIKVWCSNTAVVQILTPQARIGEKWQGSVDGSYRTYHNCIHLGYLPEKYMRNGATFYSFTFSIQKQTNGFLKEPVKRGERPIQQLKPFLFMINLANLLPNETFKK